MKNKWRSNDVDDKPTPTITFPQAHEYAQLLSNFAMEHLSRFSVIDVKNMQSVVNKLSKMSISNINKHHYKTINSYFCSVWYGEDIITRLYMFLMWHCEHISSMEMFFHTLVSSLCIHNDILHWNKSFPWETMTIRYLRPKYYVLQNTTFLRNQTCNIKGGEQYS